MNKSTYKKEEENDEEYSEVPIDVDYSNRSDIADSISYERYSIVKTANISYDGRQFVVRIPNEI